MKSIESTMEEGAGRKGPGTTNGGGWAPAQPPQGHGGPPENLKKQVQLIGGNQVKYVAVLSFRTLLLARIAALQKDLVATQLSYVRDGMDPGPDTDDKIQKYADAVRNFETLTQDVVTEEETRYLFLGENTEFEVVKRSDSKGVLKYKDPELTVQPEAEELKEIGPLGFRELDKGRRVERERKAALSKARYLRLQMAVFGGVALIVPMLIMTLLPGLVVNLVTVSVVTLIFGAVMVVFGTDSTGKDVLASTAAYAAVLVVFVGASLSPSSD